MEIGGFQLNFKEKYDGITRDVAIGVNQNVQNSEVEYPDILYSIDSGYDKGYKVVGLWHSHADFGVFHSQPDDSILKDVYFLSKRLGKENLMQFTSYDVESKLETQLNKDTLDILLGAYPLKIKLDLTSIPKEVKQYLLSLNQVDVQIPILQYYSASLVINNSCFDYGLDEMDKLVQGKNYYIKTLFQPLPNSCRINENIETKLEIVHERNSICTDENELTDQIIENVHYNGQKHFKTSKRIRSHNSNDFSKIVEQYL